MKIHLASGTLTTRDCRIGKMVAAQAGMKMDGSAEQIVSEIWSRRAIWSSAANRLNRQIKVARISTLMLSAGGAVFSALAATISKDWARLGAASAGAGAACLAASAYIGAQFISIDRIWRWTRIRALSEAVKSEVFVFRAAAFPYDGNDAAPLLQRKVRTLEASMQDLENLRKKAGAAAAPVPLHLDPDGYIEARVLGQVNGYYRPKAQLYMRRLSILRSAQNTLNLLAAMLGGVAAYLSARNGADHGSMAAWIAVITTIAASLAAHQAAVRYEFLVTSFYATAARLEELVEDWRLTASSQPQAWSAFVRECETAISTENDGWMSKWADRGFPK